MAGWPAGWFPGKMALWWSRTCEAGWDWPRPDLCPAPILQATCPRPHPSTDCPRTHLLYPAPAGQAALPGINPACPTQRGRACNPKHFQSLTSGLGSGGAGDKTQAAGPEAFLPPSTAKAWSQANGPAPPPSGLQEPGAEGAAPRQHPASRVPSALLPRHTARNSRQQLPVCRGLFTGQRGLPTATSRS